MHVDSPQGTCPWRIMFWSAQSTIYHRMRQEQQEISRVYS
jgi:hypothetical protein